MTWPWTSVRRLTDALEQVAWLRAENARLVEQLTRIGRHQAGLSELPRVPRPALEPMPRDLLKHFNSFDSASIRKAQRDVALRRHAAGEPWATIMADAMPPEETDNGQSP